MDTKKMVMVGVAVMVIGSGSFYGGMAYAGHKSSQGQSAQTAGGGFMRRGGMGGMMGGGGFVRGEVVAKDAGSLTVKVLARPNSTGQTSGGDGGSKIILISDSVEVSKSVKGSLSDVGIGASISANGKTNTDGSITAEAIQILPAMK